MTRGLALFLLVCALAAGTYALPGPELKWACLAGLAFVWLATPIQPSAEDEGNLREEREPSDSP